MTPFTITDKENYIEISFVGNMTAEVIEDMKAEIEVSKEIIKNAALKSGRHTDVLLDMSQYGGEYIPEAMELLAGFAGGNREYVRKTACFGGDDSAVLAGEVVTAMADRTNIKFFPTRAEAEDWLKQ